MKINKTLTALVASATMGLSGQAMAAGTAAGTTITNTVTLGYTVNTVAQTDLTGQTSFIVDTRVDFNLSNDETATVKVTPNANGYVSTFTLASTSNDTLDFNLTSADLATGSQPFLAGNVDDNFDLNANLSIFVESGATNGYQAAEDTATSVDDLDADSNVKVHVVVTSNVSDTLSDGDISAIALTATALQSTGAAIPDNAPDAFDKDVKQFVLSDSGLDGAETTNTAFEVGTASFTDPDDGTDTAAFTLDVTVINDPLCDTGLSSTSTADYSAGTCPNAAATYIPKAIPGAMVKYTIKAKNSGSLDATSVTFSEDLSTIGDIDGDSSTDLVQNSLDNVSVNFSGVSTPVDSSTTNILNVSVATFETNATIEISFTAIVE